MKVRFQWFLFGRRIGQKSLARILARFTKAQKQLEAFENQQSERIIAKSETISRLREESELHYAERAKSQRIRYNFAKLIEG